jgi:hypothetical protein
VDARRSSGKSGRFIAIVRLPRYHHTTSQGYCPAPGQIGIVGRDVVC